MQEPATSSETGAVPAMVPVADMRFAVVDVETSGLRPRRHRVLQVGVVVVDGAGTVLDTWSTLVRPRNRLVFRVGPRHIHGIRRRSLRAAPAQSEVMAHVAGMLEGAVLVAHNVAFDLAFLRKAADEVGVTLPIDSSLCTLKLSRRLDPTRQLSHRLADICLRYDIQLLRPHDALADAEATAAALHHLLAAHGITTAQQVSEQFTRAA